MCGGNNAFSDFFIRPDRWLREHRDEAKIAALVAAAVAAPYAAGAFGAAGAAGVGAAEAGAGAGALTAEELAVSAAMADLAASEGVAAGASAGVGGAGTGAIEGGLLGAGTGAGEFGADAALGAGTGAEYGGLLGAGTGAGEYAPEVASAMDIGAPMGTASGNPLEAWGNVDPRALENGVPDFNTFGAQSNLTAAKIKGYMTGDNVYKGLKALNAAHRYSSLASPPPAMSQAATRPPQRQGSGDSMAALQAFYANPAGQERLKQLLRARGVQV